jgi:two-component system OmpR family sensor kinase
VAITALLVAASLLVVAGVVLRLTRQHLDGELERHLSSVVRSFQEGPAAGIARAGDLAPAARRWLAGQPHGRDEVVAVRTATGDVLSTSGGLDLGTLAERDQALGSAEARWWQLKPTGGGATVEALSVPLVTASGESAGTLLAAASRDRIDTTVSDLMSAIGWASLLGLAFAVLLALLAIRRTLRPLRKMAAEIEVIRPQGELPRHLPVETPADEVGRLSEAFDRLLVRIDDAIVSQRRFISDASHELRTPLTVAKGHLELLADPGDADSRRSLRMAREELDRVGRIVEDLLLLARLDEGMPLERVPVEVELVLREAALRGMLLAGNGEDCSAGDVVVDVPEGLYVLADSDRLLQVVSNLVTNALRYGGDGVVVTLLAENVGRRIRISVADTGPGIPPADLDRLFERFYRGGNARAAAPGGAGIGLPIVASLVRAMGGEVQARSTVGAGTEFTVTLPAAASQRMAASRS